MKQEITSRGVDTHYSLVKVERGIAYFEGGWWMHDSDRRKAERMRQDFRQVFFKRNEDTKQVEIDYPVYL